MPDSEEREHPKSLRELRMAANQESACWDNWHRLGVRLSEVAESIRFLGRKRRARELLQEALDAFGTAHGHAVHTTNRLQILCDQELARARLAGLDGKKGRLDMQAAYDSLKAHIDALRQEHRHHCDVATMHQLAIAYGLLARTSYWKRFGFAPLTSVYPDEALDYFRTAERLFWRENIQTPDRAKAYRSLLLYYALALYNHDRGLSNSKAQLALNSARAHGDRAHKWRAHAILWFGMFGERALRALRDGITA